MRQGCVRRSGIVFSAVVALALAASGARAAGGQEPRQGIVVVPSSSLVRPQDFGKRAHTNHLIFIPTNGKGKPAPPPPSMPTMGETPMSLACVYQTASALASGCPIIYSPTGSEPDATGGSGVIAVVDAYDYPTAQSDFDTFSTQYGLPSDAACNGTHPCFTKVYASGHKPKANCSWAQEAALDIEWSHAMAPNAQIVLVEAASNSFSNLLAAVQVASNEVLCGAVSCPSGGSGRGEVSVSWGANEFSLESLYDSYFTGAGVTYFAASGDTGGVVIWPSASPNVVSAGGTSISRGSNGNFSGETAWGNQYGGTGGGPSAYESQPSYQNVIASLLGGARGTPDFSFDADPASGVSVYDSTSCQGLSGWLVFGGTSVSAPSLSGIVNLAGQFNSANNEQNTIYSTYGTTSGTCTYSTAFNDITSGTAGSYSATTGWDFTTGVGSNKGLCGK